MKEIFDIIIIPAKFVEKTDDGEFIMDVLIQNKPKRRRFSSYSLEGINNPNLILIGIMYGDGFQQFNFIDVNEYEDLFKNKWSKLLK